MLDGIESMTNLAHPNFSKIPKYLFWDTDFDTIDWKAKAIAVIRRVNERGDDIAKEEIRRFYGEELVKKVLSKQSTRPMKLYINK